MKTPKSRKVETPKLRHSQDHPITRAPDHPILQWAIGHRPSAINKNFLRPASGAILLELMLSLALLVLGLGIIGAQFSNGLAAAHRSEIRLRCAQLAELKLAELDAQLFTADQSTQGDFGPAYLGFTWTLASQSSTAIPELPTNQQIYNLTLTVTYDSGGTKETFALNTVRSGPITFDLTQELGMETDQLNAFASAVPLPSVQSGMLDMSELKSLDPATLLQMLPQIAKALGLPNADAFSSLMSDPTQLMNVLTTGQLPSGMQQQLTNMGVDQGTLDTAINQAQQGGKK